LFYETTTPAHFAGYFINSLGMFLSFKNKQKNIALLKPKIVTNYKAPSSEFLKLQSKATAVKHFIKQNHCDTSFCFLST